jgi:uncharacterized protein with HEPN domain
MQIGENLNKLNSSNEEIIKASQGSYAVRNFIAHDYEGVNLALIENIVRNLLKPLKTELEKELIEIDLKNGDFQVQSAKEHIDDIKKEL